LLALTGFVLSFVILSGHIKNLLSPLVMMLDIRWDGNQKRRTYLFQAGQCYIKSNPVNQKEVSRVSVMNAACTVAGMALNLNIHLTIIEFPLQSVQLPSHQRILSGVSL